MKDTKVDVARRQPHLIARASGDSIVPAPMPKPIPLKPEPRPTSKLDSHELRSLLATQRRTRSISDLQVASRWSTS